MTSASDTSQNLSLGSGIAALHAKWGWIVALGIVYLIAGFVALGQHGDGDGGERDRGRPR